MNGKLVSVIADKWSKTFAANFERMTKIEFNHTNTAPAPDLQTPVRLPGQRASFAELMTSKTEFSAPNSAKKPNSDESPVEHKNRIDSRTGKNERNIGQKDSGDLNKADRGTKDSEDFLSLERGSGCQPASQFSSGTELKVPPARSIMHIMDLERLVASIRAQKIDGIGTITVNLKSSIFEGLEFRISFEQGSRLKAEFVATNEPMRAAIMERSGELIRLFEERGIELGSLNVSLGGGSPQYDQPSNQPKSPSISATSAGPLQSSPEPDYFESRTSYLT